MANGKTKPTKMSRGKVITKESPGGSPKGQQPGTARAHRQDTTEAKQQREGTPKTHPTRPPTSTRKDKP